MPSNFVLPCAPALEFAEVAGPAIMVGHSVSAMIGLLAGIAAPARVSSHVMVGPSPCYVIDGDYYGGFTRQERHRLAARHDAVV